MHFLIDDGINLEFHVAGLWDAIENILKSSYRLAADFISIHNDSISMHGLLGIDILKYMGPIQLINFMNFEFSQGIVPFENVADLKCPNSNTVNLVSNTCDLSYGQVVAKDVRCPISHVYFVMNRRSNYFDSMECFFFPLILPQKEWLEGFLARNQQV